MRKIQIKFNRNNFNDEKDVRISNLEKLLQKKINGHEISIKNMTKFFDSLDKKNTKIVSEKDEEIMALKQKIQEFDEVIKNFDKIYRELNSEKIDLQLKCS
jgi:predicted transcriptional regulator